MPRRLPVRAAVTTLVAATALGGLTAGGLAGTAAARPGRRPPSPVAATSLVLRHGATAPLRVGRRLGAAPFPSLPHAAAGRSGAALPTSLSTNWAGLAGTATGVRGAAGQWVVPKVAAVPASGYSASWVGVDGVGNTDLIQTGTEQDAGGTYFAWWEILPAPATVITQANGQPEPVRPGDRITASVQASTTTPGDWTITLQDLTQNWSFTQLEPYSGPGASAEWIEEAPTVNGVQSTPADFGTVHFAGTSIYTAGPTGTGWYATRLGPANEVALVNPAGTNVLALPSAPTPLSPPPGSPGQRFTVTYLTAPYPPAALHAARHGRAGVWLGWAPPKGTGGAPLSGYRVQLLHAGRVVRTLTTTLRTVKLPAAVVKGKGWSFRVQAVSIGNQTSRWTLPKRLPAVHVHPATLK